MHAHNSTCQNECRQCGARFQQVRRFGPIHAAKAVMEDGYGFGAHTRRDKQLTSTGKLVTTHSLLVRGFDYVSHLS